VAALVLLDTNVLSELMRPAPTEAVTDWVASQALETLCTAAPCQAEILAGIAVLPEGRRRDALAAAADGMFAEDFAGRVLPFDDPAARAYATLFAARQQAGRPAGTIDLMVAAIARSQGAAVATRNGPDFAGCGIAVIDPWQAT
jgi:predicted nucleic acid-binding protein